jgi:hypothetical protein
VLDPYFYASRRHPSMSKSITRLVLVATVLVAAVSSGTVLAVRLRAVLS